MMQYRTHADGPLTTINIMIFIDMDFDIPGTFTRMHSHVFDHWMECISGAAVITMDDAETILLKGERYLVEAGKRHGVVPLESGTKLRCEQPYHGDIPIGFLDQLTHRSDDAIAIG